MKSTMMDFQLTLAPMLERAGTLYPRVEIVSRRPDRSLHRCTYLDLAMRVRTLAGALMAAGLQRGERVATLMWNHSVHLEAYFGIPLAGGVIHTLNLRLPPQQLALIANHAGDRFVIVDEVLLPLLESFIREARFERVFVHRCVSVGAHVSRQCLGLPLRGDAGGSQAGSARAACGRGESSRFVRTRAGDPGDRRANRVDGRLRRIGQKPEALAPGARLAACRR